MLWSYDFPLHHRVSCVRLQHLLDSLDSVTLAVTGEEIAEIDKDGDQGEGSPPWKVV